MKPMSVIQAPQLNLVALMDIFTILVFFLMVNSSHVEVMEGESSMSLPIAYSEQSAAETLKITIIENSLILQGREIIQLHTLDLTAETIPALRLELEYQATKSNPATQDEHTSGRSITLFADESVPYEVLRLVLATCARTDYRKVSLAVESPVETLDNPREPKESQGVENA